MPTPSIGAYEFLTLRGSPDPMGQTSASIRRANVDGKAFHLTGQNSPPFALYGERDIACADDDNPAEVQTFIENIKALEGSLVDVVDDLGNSWDDVWLVRFTPFVTERKALAVGGVSDGGKFLLRGQLLFETTEIPS